MLLVLRILNTKYFYKLVSNTIRRQYKILLRVEKKRFSFPCIKVKQIQASVRHRACTYMQLQSKLNFGNQKRDGCIWVTNSWFHTDTYL